jgi:hypothetical protein
MKLLNCFKCPFLSNFLLISSTFALSASTFAAPRIKDVLQLKVIGKNEHVVFFPTCAYQTLEKDWIVPIHGWIYNPERRSKRRRAVLSLLTNVVDDVLDLDESEINKDILYKRVNPFIVDNHRRRKITLRFNDEIQRELPKRSRKNGHFTASLKFTPEELEHIRNSENTISYQAVTGIKNDNRVFQGTTQVLEPTGFSVISDVDDTIKLSYVLDKKKLVRHTFLQDFVAVPDMSNLYQRWYKERHASFHYVSSSPWQLYSELALFLQSTGFPPASSFSLKSIRLKDRSVLTLFADPMVSKLAKISSLLETYPRRTFVLVGDTGERDPEVYGEICRQYPNQVERVFLRDVIGGLSEEVLQTLKVKQEKKKRGIVLNAPDRLEKAFDGVSPETWSVFTNVKEINY